MAKRITTENKQTTAAQNTQGHQISLFLSSHWFGVAAAIALTVILSLAGSMDSSIEKWTGLLAAIFLLILLLVKSSTDVLRNYITPLFYSFIAYIIWGGISTLYAASGKFAISEFSKLLIALSVYLAVLLMTNADKGGFKRIARLVASAGCFFGIISVDAASLGILYKLFKAIFGRFTEIYGITVVYEEGIRINGIFGNANSYAGFMALSVILSLYLVSHATSKKDSRIAVSLLAVNALSYLLAFSIGSLFMFTLACLVMIGTSVKGERIKLFLIMVETAVSTFIFVFLAMIGIGKTGAAAALPFLALILNAVVLILMDERIRTALSKKMNASLKASVRIVILIVILIAGYLFAALSVSSQMPLSANANSVMRTIYVPGGDYTLSVESSSPVNIIIQSQNRYDLMRHTTPIIFSGSNEKEVKFTVPDDSKIVRIYFLSTVDNIVANASYSGAASGNVHLKYPLLPDFIANRIQNLFANENAVQRVIFFEDGMKLFAKSPVIGRGLGGFENGVYSVQDFYYQTKYAHNHYIQALCDLGIIGFLLFLGILISSVFSIIKAKRQSRALFVLPALAACIVQVFGQALVDVVWSTVVFLAFSSAILAAITIFCSNPHKMKEPINLDRVRIIDKVVLVTFTGLFVVLITGNLVAQAQAKSGVHSFDDIKRLIAIDRFEYNDYKLSYIINAVQSKDDKIKAQADVYASELMQVESNSLTPYLMDYYCQNYYDYAAYQAAKQGIKNNKSNPNFWIQIFNTFEKYIDPVGPNVNDAANRLQSPENYINNVLDIYDMLRERNKNSLDNITLSPSNNAFIGKFLEIKATNRYNVDWVFTAVMNYAFDSACAVDANQDGLPDSMSIAAGNAQGKVNGVIAVSDNTVLDFNLYHKLHGTYTFKVETASPQGIRIAYIDQEQRVTYEKNAAYITIDLGDNSNQDISKFTVSFPSAIDVDAVTFTTKLKL